MKRLERSATALLTLVATRLIATHGALIGLSIGLVGAVALGLFFGYMETKR